MRESKFRAWDKKSKKMRAINSIAFHGLGHFDIPTQDIKLINLWGYNIIEEKHIIVQREPGQVELLQFTGLKDENGTEIYEGDIVRHAADEGVYKVIFEDGGFYVKNLFEYDFQTINEYPLEVIGNIYENPGLLEVD